MHITVVGRRDSRERSHTPPIHSWGRGTINVIVAVSFITLAPRNVPSKSRRVLLSARDLAKLRRELNIRHERNCRGGREKLYNAFYKMPANQSDTELAILIYYTRIVFASRHCVPSPIEHASRSVSRNVFLVLWFNNSALDRNLCIVRQKDKKARQTSCLVNCESVTRSICHCDSIPCIQKEYLRLLAPSHWSMNFVQFNNIARYSCKHAWRSCHDRGRYIELMFALVPWFPAVMRWHDRYYLVAALIRGHEKAPMYGSESILATVTDFLSTVAPRFPLEKHQFSPVT